MSRFWFQDFVPKQTQPPGLLRLAEYESFENAVIEANRWIEETGVSVVRFETVVLPNIWSEHEEGTTDSSLGTRGSIPSHWHQFVRVWYIDETEEHLEPHDSSHHEPNTSPLDDSASPPPDASAGVENDGDASGGP